MRLRSILAISLSIVLLNGCGGNEPSKEMKNTSKVLEPISLIKLSEVNISFDKCLLRLTRSDKVFDIEIINFKRVSSFKTREIEENNQQHHIIYFDGRAVALADEGTRATTEYNYTNCAHRM